MTPSAKPRPTVLPPMDAAYERLIQQTESIMKAAMRIDLDRGWAHHAHLYYAKACQLDLNDETRAAYYRVACSMADLVKEPTLRYGLIVKGLCR